MVFVSEWTSKKLSDIVLINPKETLKKESIAPKISMDILQPFCRDIPSYELAEYNGGAKFRNGDTIMARITPCLENGKTAKVGILAKNEIGFGSTEYIVFRAIDGITDEDFVYYLVCSPIIRHPAIKSMVGSSGRQRVQIDVLQSLIVSIPDLLTQRKIGSVLKSIDDKIAIDGKNIAEMNETEIQQLAALFDIYSIPLPNIMSITALRERACQEYLKNVAGLDIDKDEIKKTLNCYTVTPAGTYKFELGEEQICVDTALLKDANIKEVKTTKLNISEFLNSVKNKILGNKVEKLNEDQSGNGEDETDDKLKGLSNILIDN